MTKAAPLLLAPLQRLFDIAKIYGGQLAEMPVKPAKRVSMPTAKSQSKPLTSPSRPPQSARPAGSPGKPVAMGTSMMAAEQDRLDALKRKVLS